MAFHVTAEFLSGFDPPPVPDGTESFVVASSEWDADHAFWLEDRTTTTDSLVIAALWALAFASRADDGENTTPVARVTAFGHDPNDPGDDGELREGTVVLYALAEGELLEPGDEDFEELAVTVAGWSEIVKFVSEEEDGEGGEA